MGRNAIHRLGHLLAIVDGWPGREPVIDGCQYREAVQAVMVRGGVAGNVVPDEASVVLNHRFAPDRDEAEAGGLAALLARARSRSRRHDSRRRRRALGSDPASNHPLLATLIARNHLDVRAKLGWTDVARFSSRGIPAANFGPGDPLLAHAT